MAANEISGTTWVVQQIGADTTRAPLPQITFGDDGRLTGTGGVNRLMGSYEVGEGTISFGPGATTKMAGPPEAMAQEQALTAVLVGDLPYELTGDRLLLGREGEGVVLVRPSAPPLPEAGSEHEGLAVTSPARSAGRFTPSA